MIMNKVDALVLDLTEDRYVIRRNQKDVADIRLMLKAHIDDDSIGITDIRQKVDKLAEDSEKVTGYVNKMAAWAWVMDKIKIVWLYLVGLGATFVAVYEVIRHFEK